MKLFQWFMWKNIRRFGNYVPVSRSTHVKKSVETNETVASLAKALHLKITANGPITVADYMRTSLTNPSVGYYMKKAAIGSQGDFTTSPEISQIYGEIIGLWIFNEYKKLGSPKPWQIIELGPGRGTLMSDILRTLRAFKGTNDVSIHLVEISRQMASIQAQLLCSDVIEIGMIPEEIEGNSFYKSSTTYNNIPIYWYEKLDQVPKGFSIVIAHEFFDALPIHKFQKVGNKWHEVLINSSVKNECYAFNYVLSKKEFPLSKLLIKENDERQHLELSFEAGTIASNIAQRLEEFGGFSLFIDYGHDGDKTDTFRAFKNHELVDPLVSPGTADLTADVDFSFLREIMKSKTLTFGPVDQGKFLKKLGILYRLNLLIKNEDEKTKKQFIENVRMLIEPSKMGSRYKCFAAFPLVLESHFKNFPLSGFHN